MSKSSQSAPDRIYSMVVKELNLPDPLPAQFGITLDSISDAYQYCINVGLTPKQAEQTIIKMWKNSITIT